MILSPIQNGSIFLGGQWLQTRPYITQLFGDRPDVYKQFNLKGHDGVDFRAREGTPIFAPFEGTVKIKDSGKKGYGLHIRIFKNNLECVLAHLSEVLVKDGDYVYLGQKIGLTGNTGFSSAAHLHFGVRKLADGKILDYDNGFFGYYDFAVQTLTWKGALNLNTL